MARTKRQIVRRGVYHSAWTDTQWILYRRYRAPKTTQIRRLENMAAQELKACGFLKNRVAARGNLHSGKIPYATTDKPIAAFDEVWKVPHEVA